MDPLVRAANTPNVAALIDRFYAIPEIEGFALGVHGNFVSLFRAEFGRQFSVADILNDGRVPALWPSVCKDAGFSVALSPIYVVIYVTLTETEFRSKYQPPNILESPDFFGLNQALFVETIERYKGLADRVRHRPVITGGISVSNASALAGTLGGFVQNAAQAYVLSCSHVLSDSLGTDVIQQGTNDGGTAPTDTVANTLYNVPLVTGTGFSFGAPFNSTDAALAKLNGSATASPHIRSLGRVTSTLAKSQLGIGDDVVFVGKESDSQDCRIYRYIARIKIDIHGTLYNFGDVFEIEARLPIYIGSLSRDGDSGAWVVRYHAGQPDELAGLLFAGNTTGSNKNRAVACFIDNVLTGLSNRGASTISLL